MKRGLTLNPNNNKLYMEGADYADFEVSEMLDRRFKNNGYAGL